MASICYVECIIRSTNTDLLLRVKKELEALVAGRTVSPTSNFVSIPNSCSCGSNVYFRDAGVLSDDADGKPLTLVNFYGSVDWSFDHDEAISFVTFLNSKVPCVDNGVTMRLYYEELGDDQYGVYVFDGKQLTDNFLSPSTIDKCRELRDAKNDEDKAFDEYLEDLEKELESGSYATMYVHTFSTKKCPKEHACPKCNSSDLDNDPLDSDYLGDGGTVWWPTKCLICGHEFNQLYRLTFIGVEDV